MPYYGNYVDIPSTQTITGDKTFTITGAATTIPITAVMDSSAASKPAVLAKNNTNFAHGANILQLQMVNATDSGKVLRVENSGTGANISSANGTTETFAVGKDGSVTMADAANIVLGTTTGTKIGTSTTQKIAFYNSTPIAKQTGVAITANAIHAALTSLGLIAP